MDYLVGPCLKLTRQLPCNIQPCQNDTNPNNNTNTNQVSVWFNYLSVCGLGIIFLLSFVFCNMD